MKGNTEPVLRQSFVERTLRRGRPIRKPTQRNSWTESKHPHRRGMAGGFRVVVRRLERKSFESCF